MQVLGMEGVVLVWKWEEDRDVWQPFSWIWFKT